MATIQTTYLGGLRTEATHIQSKNTIITDAPLDNKGKGEAFSPTDLLAASLGSCMMTIMGIAARDQNINMNGTTCSITKIMASDPRRVVEIQVVFNFPQGDYSEKDKTILKRSAENCPVAKSVHPDILQNLTFNFNEQ